MTLRFIITRHAKSDWGADDLDDHDRGLSPRGERASAAIGEWLVAMGYQPKQILCSSARRAQETVSGIAKAFKAAPAIQTFPELYLSSPQTMLDTLRRHGTKSVVMMVAHNPGSAITAQMLAATQPADADFARYPTCFTSVFEFDIKTWEEADWGKGKVVATMAPRRLET